MVSRCEFDWLVSEEVFPAHCWDEMCNFQPWLMSDVLVWIGLEVTYVLCGQEGPLCVQNERSVALYVTWNKFAHKGAVDLP